MPQGLRAPGAPAFSAAMPLSFPEFEQPIAELEAKIDELQRVASGCRGKQSAERSRGLRAKSRALTTSIFANLTSVAGRAAREAPAAPVHARLRRQRSSTDFQEMHGDRMYADDTAIVRWSRAARRTTGDADRAAEGARHEGARAAQLRHAEAGGLSQGAAADAHSPSASSCRSITPDRYRRAPIPASAPRSAARARRSRATCSRWRALACADHQRR